MTIRSLDHEVVRWRAALLERLKECKTEYYQLDPIERDLITDIEEATIERCAKWLEDMPEHWNTLAADMRRALSVPPGKEGKK